MLNRTNIKTPSETKSIFFELKVNKNPPYWTCISNRTDFCTRRINPDLGARGSIEKI